MIYILSIAIWAIVIFICTEILRERITENGWDMYLPPAPYPNIRRVANRLLVSAIPVVRLLILCSMLFMAFVPEFDI